MGAKLNNNMSPMKNNPGPGTYDLQNADNPNMSSPAKYKLGTGNRGQTMNKTFSPGPGNYKSSLVDKEQAPSFGFGSEKRNGPLSKTM